MTRKNTKIGATAFKAETNSDPSKVIAGSPGTSSAKMVPTTKPHRMRLIKLISFQLFHNFFNVGILSWEYNLSIFTQQGPCGKKNVKDARGRT